jgi:dTDP-4-dehydrorhamnose 3,5-epimerase
MRTLATDLPGVLLIEPDVHRDARGFFLETYHAERYQAAGIPGRFAQDNYSSSVGGTLRGLHAQRRRPQGKLVRVTRGEILDVVADIRRDSPTFARSTVLRLSADNFLQCWVPPGFAHGFLALSEVAEVEYKCTALYDPTDEIGVVWDDPQLAIAWPTRAPILSAKDARLPRLAEVMDELPIFLP